MCLRPNYTSTEYMLKLTHWPAGGGGNLEAPALNASRWAAGGRGEEDEGDFAGRRTP